MQKKVLENTMLNKELKIEVPEKCQCGFGNFYFWGTKVNGSTRLEVRCMRCGANIWHIAITPE